MASANPPLNQIGQLTQLGRYRIVSELGRGAMGVVYKAEDALLNRMVAIKTIIMSGDAGERAEYEARFYQEAKAAGGLNHPNVVTIHDIGREGETAYLAMELIEGFDLREMMRNGRIALPLVLDIAAQVADGLAFAHERGVFHRDVKPGNVMIARGRQAKIMDFGIARMRESDIHTRTGTILGSPKYMSPEQVAGKRTDHRSDIFSLGVMIYELVTGAAPFSAAQVTQLMHLIATATPRTPSAVNPSLPAMLDLILGKALEKQLDARYQNAAELAADLRACATALPARPSPSPDDIDATVRLGAGDPATQKIDIAAAQTQPNSIATRTAMLNAEAAPSHPSNDDATAIATSATHTRATDTRMLLTLSRRFDATEALQRLAPAPEAADGLDTSHSGVRAASIMTRAQASLRRLLRDPECRVFAVAVIAALAAAMAIAFIGVGD